MVKHGRHKCLPFVQMSLCTRIPMGPNGISNLRRGHFWHDGWRRLLAGCHLRVWSSNSGCCPGSCVERRWRSPTSTWASLRPVGRKRCPPIRRRGRSRKTWGRALGWHRSGTRWLAPKRTMLKRQREKVLVRHLYGADEYTQRPCAWQHQEKLKGWGVLWWRRG